MKSEKRLHFHSDCYFFAGSERGLPLLWGSDKLQRRYRVSFSFRDSPRYHEEMSSYLTDDVLLTPLPFRTHRKCRLTGKTSAAKRTRNNKDVRQAFFHGVFARYPGLVLDAFHLFRIFRCVRPDVVHLNNGGYPGAPSVRAAAIAARLAGCRKVVMTVNNVAYPYRSIGRFLDYPVDQLVKFCVSRFVTASSEARDALISALNLGDSHVLQIANAVCDPKIVHPPELVRQKFNVAEGVILVGLVGLLEERKGHRDLLESLATLFSQNPQLQTQIRVWFVGDGPLEDSLRNEVQIKDMCEVVHFLGYRLDYLDLINSMDILVVPSTHHEDSPLASIEAMALSKPVVATRVGALVDQVVDGETGYLVDAHDTTEMRHRLSELISDSRKRRKFGAAGRDRYLKSFSPGRFVDDYMRLYRSL